MDDFNVEVEKRDGAVIIYPKGEINAYHVSDFKARVLESIPEGEKVIIDFSNVDYVDSAGLGSLVSILKHVKTENKEMKLISLKPNLKKVFELTKLDMVFDMFDDLDSALK
ncbi:MAG: anti-sigma factor antagonist [Thermotoga sp.]|nr:MAG: anti-sigma factor antagonist [Thermotoga sp.]